MQQSGHVAFGRWFPDGEGWAHHPDIKLWETSCAVDGILKQQLDQVNKQGLYYSQYNGKHYYAVRYADPACTNTRAQGRSPSNTVVACFDHPVPQAMHAELEYALRNMPAPTVRGKQTFKPITLTPVHGTTPVITPPTPAPIGGGHGSGQVASAETRTVQAAEHVAEHAPRGNKIGQYLTLGAAGVAAGWVAYEMFRSKAREASPDKGAGTGKY